MVQDQAVFVYFVEQYKVEPNAKASQIEYYPNEVATPIYK